jgi:hypothetical protein
MPRKREDNAPQYALHSSHKEGAFEHCANDDSELTEEGSLLLGAEWDCILEALREFATVSQEEKQKVQHKEEANDNMYCALTNDDGLGGKDLAARLKRG